MPHADERKRILDMLASGQLTSDQAFKLLSALDAPPPPPPSTAIQKATTAPRGTARLLRISVDALDDDDERARIRVNVPLGLAKLAGRFLPDEAKMELNGQGIDLEEIIATITSDTPDGVLVDLDVDDAQGHKKAKIIVEVV